MKILGVEVPWWVLILLGVVAIVLIGNFIWVTVGGAIMLVLKLVGLLALVGGVLWGIQKFRSRS